MNRGAVRRRRVLRTVGASAAAGVLGLAGCTAGSGSTQLTYAGSTQGGAPYQMALTLSQEVRRATESSLRMNVQSTGGFDANVRQVGASGNFDLGVSTTPNFQAADLGVHPFEETYEITILFTSAVYPFPISFTRTGSGLSYIEDTAGSPVATGKPGSSVHTYYRLYCLANGIDWESVIPRRIEGEEAFRALDEGRVDAVMTAGINDILGPQNRQWLTRTEAAKLLPPKSSERTVRLHNAGEHVPDYPLTGGVMWELALEQFEHAWKNSAISGESSYRTVAGTNTHFATLDLDDDTAADITRVAIENRESLAGATALWAGFAEEPGAFATTMTMADAEGSPWHPGAVSALEDAGLWDGSFPVAER